MRLRESVNALLDLLLPGACVACSGRIPPEEKPSMVCVPCRMRLRRPPAPRCPRCEVPFGTGHPPGAPCLECQDWPPFLVGAHAAAVMEFPSDALVHALKYGGWRDLGRFMGRAMAASLPQPGPRALVAHVPTTTRRRRRRGYDQAEVLAEAVAELLGLPHVCALERRGGGTQVGLTPAARRRNVAGRFLVPASIRSRIRRAEVILIDDVLTTGATALAAASVLGGAEVGSVRLLTFARALPFGTEGGR